jgi:hypothetical protein
MVMDGELVNKLRRCWRDSEMITGKLALKAVLASEPVSHKTRCPMHMGESQRRNGGSRHRCQYGHR